MRASSSFLVLLLVPGWAAAAPFHAEHVPDQVRSVALHMPASDAFGWHQQDQNDLMLPRHNDIPVLAASGFSLGFIHAESETVNGRRRMHYSVDGLSVMGAGVSGSVSAHRADVFLRWRLP